MCVNNLHVEFTRIRKNILFDNVLINRLSEVKPDSLEIKKSDSFEPDLKFIVFCFLARFSRQASLYNFS